MRVLGAAAGEDMVPGGQPHVERLGRAIRCLFGRLASARRGLRAVAVEMPRLGTRPPLAGCADAVAAVVVLQESVRTVAEVLMDADRVWNHLGELELVSEVVACEQLMVSMAESVDGADRPGLAVDAGRA